MSVLYEYRCWGWHRIVAYRPMEGRDNAPICPTCGATTKRIMSLPQPPIIRPKGYSLRPGDKGFWDFETPAGLVERARVAPFAKEEERGKSPPKPIAEED